MAKKEYQAVVYATPGGIGTQKARLFSHMIQEYARRNPDWRKRKAAWLAESAEQNGQAKEETE